jgi:phosphotransacetylase
MTTPDAVAQLVDGYRRERVNQAVRTVDGVMAAAAAGRRHRYHEGLIENSKSNEPLPTAVVFPVDQLALRATVEAASAGILAPILIGPGEVMRATARTAGVDIAHLPVIDLPSDTAAATTGVGLAEKGQVQVLMKGSLHTSTLLHAVLASDTIRPSHRWLSHVFVFDVPAYPKPLLLSDAAVAIAPNLQQKAIICRNAISVAHALGIARPKVAILSAIEDIEPAVPSTLDAAALCKMADRGQITGAILDGPLAMDNAISASAAASKGISSPVAGDADVLIVPNLEAGNVLYKSLTYLAGAEAAGVIVGASVPIILASRADSVRTRISSAALASVLATPVEPDGTNGPGLARRLDGSIAGRPWIKE